MYRLHRLIMYSADKSFTLLEFLGIQDLTVQLPTWQIISPFTGPSGNANSTVFNDPSITPPLAKKIVHMG